MYYGYNDNKELIVADQEFIKLLEYSSFDELNRANILKAVTFEKNRISIALENRYIDADFIDTKLDSSILGSFYLVELKNVSKGKSNEDKSKFKTDLQLIYLDVKKISKDIGLSIEDYKLYIDSFIDQSIIDEKRLIEGNDKVIKNLSNLAVTLKIPEINRLLLKIQKLSHRERMPLIDEYYSKLALITMERPDDEEIDELFLEDDLQENPEEVLNTRFTDLLNKAETSNKNIEDDFEDFITEVHTPTVIKPQNSIKEIKLDSVSPLPISYDPQVAADELNLPVELIEEFVEDFIEQAHQDKDHLLTSYYQKDMDNIHELGHKLKGAASNLRINELADILEEIQFCTEHSKLEELIIKYWGHFLSLEDYMKQLNNK